MPFLPRKSIKPKEPPKEEWRPVILFWLKGLLALVAIVGSIYYIASFGLLDYIKLAGFLILAIGYWPLMVWLTKDSETGHGEEIVGSIIATYIFILWLYTYWVGF